jgi:1-acyl-sn-glycerol-3-phosphate acyltransferase
MWAWPHRIEFHFLPEISTQGLQVEDTDQLKQQVYQVMKNHYVANKHLI